MGRRSQPPPRLTSVLLPGLVYVLMSVLLRSAPACLPSLCPFPVFVELFMSVLVCYPVLVSASVCAVA
jgi:hypothetical protein